MNKPLFLPDELFERVRLMENEHSILSSLGLRERFYKSIAIQIELMTLAIKYKHFDLLQLILQDESISKLWSYNLFDTCKNSVEDQRKLIENDVYHVYTHAIAHEIFGRHLLPGINHASDDVINFIKDIDFLIKRYHFIKHILKKYILPEAVHSHHTKQDEIEYICSINNGELIVFYDVNGRSILDICLFHDIDIVKYLLNLGAPITEQTILAACGLYCDSYSTRFAIDKPDVLNLLIEAGAKLNYTQCVDLPIDLFRPWSPIHGHDIRFIMRRRNEKFMKGLRFHNHYTCMYHSPLYLLTDPVLLLNLLMSEDDNEAIIRQVEATAKILLGLDINQNKWYHCSHILDNISCSIHASCYVYKYDVVLSQYQCITRISKMIFEHYESDECGYENMRRLIITCIKASEHCFRLNGVVSYLEICLELYQLILLTINYGGKLSLETFKKFPIWKHKECFSTGIILFNSLPMNEQLEVINELSGTHSLTGLSTQYWRDQTVVKAMSLKHQAISTVLNRLSSKPIIGVRQLPIPARVKDLILSFDF